MTTSDDPRRRSGSRAPVGTLGLVLVVTACWLGQLLHPGLLETLRRDPSALAAGQWWRVASPLVVQDPPWQWAVLGPLTLGLGAVVERFWGGRTVVGVLLAAGLVGEAVGYAWLPRGAGSSVGAAGLLGVLVAWSLSAAAPRVLPSVLVPRVRTAALLTLVASVVSVVLHDVHGLPLLAGVAVGAFLVASDRRERGVGSVRQ